MSNVSVLFLLSVNEKANFESNSCIAVFKNVLGTVKCLWMCLWAFTHAHRHTHTRGASGRWKCAQRYSYTQSVMRALWSICRNLLHSEPSQTHHATAALKYPFQLTVFQRISWAADGRATGCGFQGPYAICPPARPSGLTKRSHFLCLKWKCIWGDLRGGGRPPFISPPADRGINVQWCCRETSMN